MALVVKDRVKETSTTTGTGTFTLNGAASGFQSFTDALTDGDTTWYGIEDGTNWETGLGTWDETAGTLARTTVYDSSNSGNAVNWGAGDKNVFITQPASRAATITVYPTIDDLPLTGNVGAGDQAYVTGNNTLYMHNGTGWYKIALVNQTPTISGNSASYTLATDGTATVVTLTGTDPEGVPITWSSVTSGDTSAATVTNVDNVFTITPSTNSANAGTLTVAFKASDGVNIGSSSSDFVLTFGDDDFASTVLLLQGNGTASGDNNTFLDSSSNAQNITRNGNVTQGSFSAFSVDDGKWGIYCLGGFVKTNNNITLGTNDFTIEFWVYPNDLNSSILWSDWRTSVSQAVPTIYSGNGTLYYYVNGGSVITAPTSLVTNQWQHIAVERVSGTTTLYLDGVSQGTYADSTNYIGANAAFGGYIISPSSFRTNGYMSNARVVNGSAVYNGAFTPPTAPLTNVTNTAVLTCQSNQFVDSSGNYSIVITDSPEVAPFSPFPQTTVYSASTNGGSGYFDGTGDYLTLSSDIVFSGAVDFTVECWVYTTATDASAYNIIFSGGGGNVQFIIDPATGNIGAYLNAYMFSNTGTAIKLNTWQHVAWTRSQGTSRGFVDGVLIASGSHSAAFNIGTIGRFSGGGYEQNGYMSDVRIIKGTALYTSAFTPPTAPLTDVTNTELLCNFTNASILDATGKNVLETVGNATIDGTTKKYGSGAMKFDGTGDGLSSSNTTLFGFGAGDFTIETWAYLTTNGVFNNIVSGGVDSSNGYRLDINTSNNLRLLAYIGGSWGTVITGSTSLATGQWYHLAVTRSGNDFDLWVDGSSDATTVTNSGTITGPTTKVEVGAVTTNSLNRSFNGFMDDLRITKGIARYTANFTVPTKHPDLGT